MSDTKQLGLSHHRVDPDKMYILMAFVVVLLMVFFVFFLSTGSFGE